MLAPLSTQLRHLHTLTLAYKSDKRTRVQLVVNSDTVDAASEEYDAALSLFAPAHTTYTKRPTPEFHAVLTYMFSIVAAHHTVHVHNDDDDDIHSDDSKTTIVHGIDIDDLYTYIVYYAAVPAQV